MYNLSTPVVFLIYRRPDLTQQVFNEIAKAKPKQLFVVADGPKNPEDMPRCQATRAIIEQVNWDCEVKTNYADQNMGLRKRISSGLNWVFEQVERAIILEDDCVPHPTFFRFCEELLEKYKDDDRVMNISGDNFGYNKHPRGVKYSYYFSSFANIWGWATWRRAWAKYDADMLTWSNPNIRQSVLSQFPTKLERDYWERLFDLTTAGQIPSWAYPWMYTCRVYNGLCIIPYTNQITNIGVAVEATNTKDPKNPRADLATYDIQFPLIHPQTQQINLKRDRRMGYFLASQYTLPYRALYKAKYLLKRLMKRIRNNG